MIRIIAEESILKFDWRWREIFNNTGVPWKKITNEYKKNSPRI